MLNTSSDTHCKLSKIIDVFGFNLINEGKLYPTSFFDTSVNKDIKLLMSLYILKSILINEFLFKKLAI